jgi:pimeloyl-ACP methyl ester carboxylesterase
MTTTNSQTIDVVVANGSVSVLHHAGAGPTLLFLHYWGGSAATWAPVQGRLVGRPMVAWDQRGWGASAGLPGPYDLDAVADDVEAVVEGLGLHDVVLVGHSQGGKIAQVLAHRRRPWLRALVLVASAPPRPPRFVDAAYREQLAHAYDSAETVQGALDAVLTATSLAPELRQRVVRDSTSASLAARSEWSTRGLAAVIDDGPVQLPTTVIVGERDRVEPPEVLQELLLPALPNLIGFHVVPGAGHLLPLEAPASVAQAITDTLSVVRAG